jgi:hypothetical protein
MTAYGENLSLAPIHNVFLPYLLLLRLLLVRPCSLFQFRITYEIMNLFRHLVGLLGRGMRPTEGLYVHSTAQHETRTNTHA